MYQITETWGPAFNNNNSNNNNNNNIIPQAITLLNSSSSSGSSMNNNNNSNNEAMERITRLASENAVVIFSISTCCMCHAIKRQFCGMGVNPTVHELDHDPRGNEIHRALMRLLGSTSSTGVPVVFVGGKLVGPMDRVMASHINGSLVPLLKEAGALWL